MTLLHIKSRLLSNCSFLYWVSGQVGLYVSPLNAKSSFLITLCFFWTADPLVFKARHFEGSPLRCRAQGFRWVVSEKLHFMYVRICLFLTSLKIVSCYSGAGGRGLISVCLCLSCTCSCGPFILSFIPSARCLVHPHPKRDLFHE